MSETKRRRYSIEIRNLAAEAFLMGTARWTGEECRTAVDRIIRLERRPPDCTTRLYWIQIKDEDGGHQLVTTWDWTDNDRSKALREICRLAQLPDSIEK
ncbi:MAG TPA: hypothetical protein VE963_15230 [Reyranella sp.]|nr:hypothetical protein [Reyranella sp.]